MNVMLSVFIIFFLVACAIIAVLLFKLITFTHTAETKIDNLQQKASQSLNVPSDLCSNSSISSLLKSSGSTICQ
jgi:archaellin